jgi:uridine kinase
VNDKQMPFVISIAAVSGGGKTTIVNRLKERLLHTEALYFDHYDFEGPDDICDWVEEGANYSDWNLTPMVHDLKLLLSEPRQPLDYILLDYPFAYLQDEMGKWIDFAIFVDTPLDIAMARRILRDFQADPIENVRADVQGYLTYGRPAYLQMLHNVRPHSDCIVDGCLSVDEIVEILLSKIRDMKEHGSFEHG